MMRNCILNTGGDILDFNLLLPQQKELELPTLSILDARTDLSPCPSHENCLMCKSLALISIQDASNSPINELLVSSFHIPTSQPETSLLTELMLNDSTIWH